HRQRRLRADALDGAQGDEGAALAPIEEPVEDGAGLFAPVAFDVQHRLVADRRQAAEGARSAADQIADAADVDQRLLLGDLGHHAAWPADDATAPAALRDAGRRLRTARWPVPGRWTPAPRSRRATAAAP